MEFLSSGKVKDIYRASDDTLCFKFSNRVSAFDNKFEEEIPAKGKVLADFSAFWFDKLGIRSHYISKLGDEKILVKRMNMIPLECIVRGYYFGSFVKRHQRGEVNLPEDFPLVELKDKFPHPIFDPTTKSDICDEPIEKNQALNDGLVTEEEWQYLEKQSLNIYNKMSKIAEEKGFDLIDIKLEFGRDPKISMNAAVEERIVLGDSIGPDEYRMWKKESGEMFDKEILRSYIKNNGGIEKVKNIPPVIVEKMSQKYQESYQLFTN